MFTGIIEAEATLLATDKEGTNLHMTFSSPVSHELRVDQSVAHNGVCLTVTGTSGDSHRVTAIKETLSRTNLGALKTGDKVNLERCMRADGRFDGHIVQGHVDTVATCESVRELGGSSEFWFRYPENAGHVTVEKGSITVNGVSLTVVGSEKSRFSVHIIPYTLGHTNFGSLKAGQTVNIEFDVIGKYVARLLGEQAGSKRL